MLNFNVNNICPLVLPVLCTPALDKRNADGAHARKLVNSLKALADTLGQLVGKLLVVEDLQVTSYEKGKGRISVYQSDFHSIYPLHFLNL